AATSPIATSAAGTAWDDSGAGPPERDPAQVSACGTDTATMASGAAITHEAAAASHNPMANRGERVAQGRRSAPGPRQPAAAAYAVSRTAAVSGLIPIMAGSSAS